MENKKNSNTSDEFAKIADEAAVTEDNFANAVDKSKEYTNKALDKELQNLAETFKQELKKAQAMTEEELIKSGIIIQQYEDEEGVIPEEELCRCCGEQRRDKAFGENYEYCRDCRNAMKKYPLSIYNVALIGAIIFVAVVSVFSFAADFDIYDNVRKGDAYLTENKLDSALEVYDSAISDLNEKDVVPKWLYLKTAEIVYDTMPEGVYSMSEVQDRIEAALTQLESELPLYNRYTTLRLKAQVLYATMNEFYSVMNSEKYADFDGEDKETYEEIMTAIGSIIDKEVTVTSIDGKTSQLVSSNAAMVRFCQYMFAYSMGEFDDSYQYMNQAYELEPTYTWLYAFELGLVELQKGNTEKAESLAEVLYMRNVEDPDGYVLRSSISRMTGNSKKAIQWADDGLKLNPDDAELYRMKAMAYITKGDYEQAEECVEKALEIEEYSFLYMVYLVVENELGNEDEVESLKEYLEEQGIKLSEKTEDYFKGKITAKQMFTEGTGDVE